MENKHCEAFIAEIPNLEESYIRKYFHLDPYTRKRMCALQKLPDDIIKEVLESNDANLIRILKFNIQLKEHF